MVQRCSRSVSDKTAAKGLSSFKQQLCALEDSSAEPMSEQELGVLLEVGHAGGAAVCTRTRTEGLGMP